MNNSKSFMFFLLLSLSFFIISEARAIAYPKIGLMTGTVSQGEEEYRAGEEVVAQYGADKVIHVTYPDRFQEEQETIISQVCALASDPDIKAIVICQGVFGTAVAINKAKEMRPDILFIVGTVYEEPYMMSKVADVLFAIDDIGRGASIVEKSKEMGAKTVIHYSFPRHMSMSILAKRRDLMKEKAEELGVNFIFVNIPDPGGEGGVAGSQQFILEDVPRQIQEYGKDTAFFATNCAAQDPLIRAIMQAGAIYPEQCCPSPFHALPSALGIKVPQDKAGNIPFVLDSIKTIIDGNNMSGRVSTWKAPIVMTFTKVASAYAMDYAEGKFSKKQDIARAISTMEKIAGKVNIRIFDEEKTPNFFLVTGESIIF